MKKITLLLLIFVAMAVVAQPSSPPQSSAIARGKYLVEQVAMCIDCHTPRNERGEFDRNRWLEGGPLGFAPTVPMPNWAPNAPAIAGLPGWTDAEAIKLLRTGLGLEGKPLRPPMPEYKMSRADAAAVVAYLRSLKRPKR